MMVNKIVNILEEEYNLKYRSFKHSNGRSRAVLEFHKGKKYIVGLFIISHKFYVIGVNGRRFKYGTLLEAKIKIMKYFTNT